MPALDQLKSVITQTCSSPANFKGQHQGFFQSNEEIAGTADVWTKVGELITRPLLFKLSHALAEHFHPKAGDVYWWDEEELISNNSEKTSYRARMVIRLKSKGIDHVMGWSSKLAFRKPAREDAARRAITQFKDLTHLSFAKDLENKENSSVSPTPRSSRSSRSSRSTSSSKWSSWIAK